MLMTKTARLKVENLAQTTYAFSPVHFRAPWSNITLKDGVTC
jgi:hypothetical protein